MTPDQLLRIVRSLKMSDREILDFLELADASPDILQRWLSGLETIPGPVAVALRLKSDDDDPLKYNRWFKTISFSMDLKSDDVINIFALTGVELSKNKPVSWRKSMKNKNLRKMKEKDFETFLLGLRIWVENESL